MCIICGHRYDEELGVQNSGIPVLVVTTRSRTRIVVCCVFTQNSRARERGYASLVKERVPMNVCEVVAIWREEKVTSGSGSDRHFCVVVWPRFLNPHSCIDNSRWREFSAYSLNRLHVVPRLIYIPH